MLNVVLFKRDEKTSSEGNRGDPPFLYNNVSIDISAEGTGVKGTATNGGCCFIVAECKGLLNRVLFGEIDIMLRQRHPQVVSRSDSCNA